jgi:anti-sigma factor RsiW
VKSCAEVRELFSDHVDGLMSETGRETLRRHVAECAACAGTLARYEETLRALRGLTPAASDALHDRVRRAATREGLLTDRVHGRGAWALAVAAALLAALAYAVHQRSRPEPGPSGSSVVAASTCAESLWGAWMVDADALRRPTPAHVPEAPLSAQGRSFLIPAALVSHGPYAADLTAAIRSDDAVCVPLIAPYGDVLVLSLARTAAGPPSGFRVVTDPRHVFYSGVVWRHGGLDWKIEGRAPAAELLSLAGEIEAGTQVPGA